MINDYLKTLRALPLQYSGAENYKSEVEYAFTEQDLNKRINFTTGTVFCSCFKFTPDSIIMW